jgi:hypothetical protein
MVQWGFPCVAYYHYVVVEFNLHFIFVCVGAWTNARHVGASKCIAWYMNNLWEKRENLLIRYVTPEGRSPVAHTIPLILHTANVQFL